MSIEKVLALAVKHLGTGTMDSSARLCLKDAREAQERGDSEAARVRALKSLAYSVGIMHPDYQAAK